MMKRYVFIFGLSALLIFLTNLGTVMSSDYETILAENSMSFSDPDCNLPRNVDTIDKGSPNYSSTSSGIGIINAEVKANIFQHSAAPSHFFSNFWEESDQKGQPLKNKITYSKKISAKGEITNFHVHFHYQSPHNISSHGFLFSNMP